MDYIVNIKGREILNARGKPTVEAELTTKNGITVIASVPSGTSRGKYEAYELYDGEERYGGHGTRKAATNISGIISENLKGHDITDQKGIDEILVKLDGTNNKSKLGGNAILAVSVAAAKAGAASLGVSPFRYLLQPGITPKLPDIVATVIAGGVFSTSGLEFEDYMMILHDFFSFPDALEALVTMRKHLEKSLRNKYGAFPEDGGALAAPLSSTEEAFEWMLATAKETGNEQKVSLGLDVAASELWDTQLGKYKLYGGKVYSKKELLTYYCQLCQKYPLSFIEDGFEQDDFASSAQLCQMLPDKEIVGDDLFVTNPERLAVGIRQKAANGMLLKINQIGTVTEAINASRLATENGIDIIVSLRSGETGDDFIADLSVAVGARQIKLGSPVREERNSKYNRLLRIWEELEN